MSIFSLGINIFIPIKLYLTFKSVDQKLYNYLCKAIDHDNKQVVVRYHIPEEFRKYEKKLCLCINKNIFPLDKMPWYAQMRYPIDTNLAISLSS